MKKATNLILWCVCLLLACAKNTQAQTPVQKNGQLRVTGTKLCNQYGNPIQLRGMSTHGIQWYGWGSCLTEASLDALAYDWGADVLRISMYVQEDGYETDPAGFTAQVNRLIEEATERGMYALVDWHQLTPGDPNYNLSRAKTFFSAIANQHKNKNNIIYDICNEPNSGATWAKIKSYADQMIPFIRAIDNDAVICVGTHGWSTFGLSGDGSLQDVVNNPLTYPNVMYTFHFYAKDHRTEYLNQLDKASNLFPVFVTEFGTQEASGDGPNDFAMAQQYIDLMARKKISWTNWNYSDDFRSGAVWITGTCSNGPWTPARLKPAGAWVRERIMSPADDFPGGGTPVCEPVTASSNDGNVPANVLDNDLNTRWSASGDGQWIQFCLNTPTSVSGVQIAFYQGTTRTSNFDVQVSDSGLVWSNVLTNVHSSGANNNLETFSFTPRTAKYVRIVGHGNSASAWNSYTEVKIQTGTGGGTNQLFTLLPAQDAYVRDGANATLIHGVIDSTFLMTKVNPSATTGNNRESYLLFDANSVSGTINSVKLKVYGKVDLTAITTIPVGVYAVANTSWTEKTLTWNNKPAAGSTALASADISSAAYSYAVWDVTSYVKSEMAAGRKLISLSLKSLASNDSRILFNSAETGNNPPQLVIDAAISTQRMIVASLVDQSTKAATGTILQSYPNPFKNNNTIVFNLETQEHVYLSVFDLTGKEVAVLVNGNLAAGSHRVNFEPGRLPAGIYTLKMVHSGKITATKLVKQ
ncbi:glycosyl hydrolase family 5 [Niastella koreensis]|uniref:Cellulase n=2 Tax=Niastella koreensis TaxID=354356 RepID=G8TM58_NIAKG|nr:cellulase family glycosylhydrolase [Niastella koreensis]AEV99831.1 Cellulase [Niastella koreensis GR20-10]OQP51551.1 glycosyl hydrolase family 5 [Niastella koreensis]